MAGEKLLERKLREQVKKMGGWAVKFWAVNLAGFPDRIVLMPRGRIWFAEIKTTGKNPTPIQRLMHNRLQDLGFEIRVISTDQELINFLNDLK